MLYASANNMQSGVELWRSTNGTLWERTNLDGFGDSNNTGLNWSNSAGSFLGQLYVGTSNSVDGGELWRMEQMPVYSVELSPSQAKHGVAGHAVTYTLTVTNTGSVSETVDLAATGNHWTTTLSPQVVSLAPGSSRAVTVEVWVPPAAATADRDQVSIQGTCRHDTSKYDSAVLTTVSTGQLGRIYLPVVSMSSPQ